ncbi:MAG: tRNA lysidine(34) synthetase TilS [Phycisphaerales bacterium]|nr:MAG: tRNA lysidine(34) synthetase TilS [Phycisphaerales bacterium]
MIKALSRELEVEGRLKRGERVVVGVSGGPDSMALLHILTRLSREFQWNFQLMVAHLNHGLRDLESEKDAAFVQAAADSLELPATIEFRDVRALAGEQGRGIEETARQARYAFFERVAKKHGSKIVALAHHSDDNAETILHRILRGTGLRGLSGIPAYRPMNFERTVRVIRPLLRHTRQEILEYLQDQGVAYREDKSNESLESTRNRIRHQVMPLLEREINPQVRDALLRLGEQAHWLEEFLRETVQRTFDTLVISHTDQTLELNVDAMGRKSPIVQTELVRLAYSSFGLGEQDLSFGHLVSVLDLVGEHTSGKQVNLPGGMTVKRQYHRLVFSLPSDQPRETIASEIAVHVPGRTVLPIRRLEISCQVLEFEAGQAVQCRDRSTRTLEFVSYDAIHLPLVVRSRRPGERFWPLGAPGTKKVSDFLGDVKVDPAERDRVAVLCDQLGPIWIIGHRIDERVKLTALTRRVLQMSVKPYHP